MVTRLSHTSLFVNDINKAYDFYVNKLGFKLHTDVPMENGYRWLTVTAPEAPDHEIVLLDALNEKGGLDKEVRDALKFLMEKNVLGSCILYTADCKATYEELKARGVDITEPREQFYGTECIIKDGCGNWFSMTQPKEGF